MERQSQALPPLLSPLYSPLHLLSISPPSPLYSPQINEKLRSQAIVSCTQTTRTSTNRSAFSPPSPLHVPSISPPSPLYLPPVRTRTTEATSHSSFTSQPGSLHEARMVSNLAQCTRVVLKEELPPAAYKFVGAWTQVRADSPHRTMADSP